MSESNPWSLSTRTIVLAAIFAALVIALQLTGIGSIPVPNTSGSMTTLIVPVIVGAIIGGPLVGMFAGLVMGVIYLLLPATAAFGPITLIIPRLLMALVAWAVYNALKGTNKIVAAVVAGAVGALCAFTTLLFAIGQTQTGFLCPTVLFAAENIRCRGPHTAYNGRPMLRDGLRTTVETAIKAAQTAGDLPAFDMPMFTVDRPRQAEHADHAVSVAMQLARVARMAPPKIAEVIARHIPATDDYTVEAVAGYINFKLTPAYLSNAVDGVLRSDAAWGNVDVGQGRPAQVEHGSANPTGFATMGTARNVTVGDTLANVLDAAGYATHREWYINDRGSQIVRFGRSLYTHYCAVFGIDEPLPPKGYPGDDVIEIAKEIAADEGDHLLKLDKDAAARYLGRTGVDRMMARIRNSMTRLGVRFDNWFSETSLHTSGLAERMLGELRERGVIIEHDGAVWFSEDGSPIRAGQGQKRDDYSDDEGATASDGEEAEEKSAAVQAVIFRSPRVSPDPEDRPTYFFSDVPYVWNKLVERKFNPAVYVWGEDHQGDVPRLYAATQVLGLDEKSVRILIYRFITLMRGGQEVRMGKRAGNAIWVDDVIDDVGKDAIRFTLLSRSIDTKIVFDLDLLKQQNDKNPVYYVQYGHARIASIFRKAAEVLEMDEPAIAQQMSQHGSVLAHPAELALMRKLIELPEIIALVADTLQPHHLTTYAQSLCAAFSKFYEACPILKEPRLEPAAMYSRLRLARAAQLTLARTLGLMGMDAPERM
jgi:arginyl-tRNA synthetase